MSHKGNTNAEDTCQEHPGFDLVKRFIILSTKLASFKVQQAIMERWLSLNTKHMISSLSKTKKE